MKRIALSLLTIAAVAVMATGATGAYFSDKEVLAGNTFAAGSLDLELGTGATMPFNVSNLAPGQSGTGKATLTNKGTLDGTLNVALNNLVMSENGLVAPELAAGDYENGGDLHLFLRFAAFADMNRDGVFNAGDVQLTYDGQQKAYPGFWGGDFHYTSIGGMMNGSWNVKLPAGESVDIVTMWQFPTESQDSNYSQNIAMTDSLGFDTQFTLNQAN